MGTRNLYYAVRNTQSVKRKYLLGLPLQARSPRPRGRRWRKLPLVCVMLATWAAPEDGGLEQG